MVWSDDSDAHIAKHNVRPTEVEQVVNSRPQWEHCGLEDGALIYGRTDAGRHLLVVLVESADGRWHVATARDLTAIEMRALRRKDADTMGRKTTLNRLAEHYDSADTAGELEDATAAGQPDAPPTTERMTTFAVRLPVAALDHVREVAAQRGVTTSALIRSWSDAGIAGEEREAEGRVVLCKPCWS